MNVVDDTGSPALEAPADADAAARSRIYALLAEAFAYPEGGPVLRLLDGDWMADIRDAIELSPLQVELPQDIAIPGSKSAINDLQVGYSAIFDVISGSPKVSLLERRYGDHPEQKLWQDLLAFYGHFGLDFSRGYAEEQPDHLLTELGFMHYLSFLEAGSDHEQTRASLQRGQRDFLALHLAAWMDDLATKLNDTHPVPPYAILGRILADVVAADADFLKQTIQ